MAKFTHYTKRYLPMLPYQPENGYFYNSDSILLYGFIAQLNLKGKVLDIGAGCGIGTIYFM